MVLMLGGCGGATESTADGEATDGGTTGAAAPTAEEDTASAPAAEADLTVALGEWVVEPDATSVQAGTLAVTADNQGGEPHELVIVRGDDPTALPTDEDGAVDETQIPEEDFIGEIEEFPNGEQRSGTFDLEPGTYVLFCNITETLDDGEVESHFANGMNTTLAVE
jgi:plastocyanin